VAARFNPDLKAKFETLTGAGKPPKLAITAIMRKILILANALLRDGREWALNVP
jgi:transposase